MGASPNVIKFPTPNKAISFSPSQENGGKFAQNADKGKISEALENTGLQAVSPAPQKENSGERKGEKKQGAKKGKTHTLNKPAKAHFPTKPKTTATGGPDGYKVDCAKMTATELRLAYPGEYTSWGHRKSYCKRHDGWVWAHEWETFPAFLLDMGPKPSPAHTLERVANDVKAYGPGLNVWLDKTGQNNNKGDNVKIVSPGTGKVFTSKTLAKLHGVSVKTIYGRVNAGWSDLELIAGKKSPELLALNVKLDELPPTLPKGKKAPAKQINIKHHSANILKPSTIPSFSDEPEGFGEDTVLAQQFGVFGDEGPQSVFGHVGDEIVEQTALPE